VSATRCPDAVAGAKPTAATDAALATSGPAQVVDLANVFGVTDRLGRIQEGWVTDAAGPARATGGPFWARGHELAEEPERTKLDVGQLVALFVLPRAVFIGLALGLAGVECAKVLALAGEATAPAHGRVGALCSVG